MTAKNMALLLFAIHQAKFGVKSDIFGYYLILFDTKKPPMIGGLIASECGDVHFRATSRADD